MFLATCTPLAEAKEMIPYGKWGEWLEKEVEFSQSTATNYMRLFEEYGAAQISIFGARVDSQTFARLPYSKALHLLAVPKEEREDFAKEVDVDSLSVSQLIMPNRQALETVINLRFKKIKDYIDVDYMRDVMLSTFGTDKFTCADVTGIIEQCAFLAMQEYREKGGKGPYVRINELHFRKVMSTFQRSVKDEDVLRYRSFKDQRQ